MELQKKDLGSRVYNTAIKDISGLADFSSVFDVIAAHCNDPNSVDSIFKNNEFGIRTEKTLEKVRWAINNAILDFRNENHSDLICRIFSEQVPFQDKKMCFYWHFALNNRLFREISAQVFSKVYFSGRAAISQDDIAGFIQEHICGQSRNNVKWTDNTIYRLSTKYLSLMTKMDFVTSGRVKSFNPIRPSSEAQVLFLYFASLYSPESNNILKNDLLPISFISPDDIKEKLKKLSLKGFFNLSFNGVDLNIQLTHSYKEICNVLYVG